MADPVSLHCSSCKLLGQRRLISFVVPALRRRQQRVECEIRMPLKSTLLFLKLLGFFSALTLADTVVTQAVTLGCMASCPPLHVALTIILICLAFPPATPGQTHTLVFRTPYTCSMLLSADVRGRQLCLC